MTPQIIKPRFSMLLIAVLLVNLTACGVKKPPIPPKAEDDGEQALVDDKDAENRKKKSQK